MIDLGPQASPPAHTTYTDCDLDRAGGDACGPSTMAGFAF